MNAAATASQEGARYPRMLTVQVFLEDLGKCWQTQKSSDSATYKTITARWQPEVCSISADSPPPRGWTSYPPHADWPGWLVELGKWQPHNIDSTKKSQLLDDKSRFLKVHRADPVRGGGTACTHMLTARVLTAADPPPTKVPNGAWKPHKPLLSTLELSQLSVTYNISKLWTDATTANSSSLLWHLDA